MNCPRPENLQHGEIVITGKEATFTCHDGYRLVGPKTRTCITLENTVMWSNAQPTCIG